jgi:hypothetical protein
MTEILNITHNAGFYSCYTIRLENIVEYFNKNKKLPLKVNSSNQFKEYKINKSEDYTNKYIKINDSININYINDIRVTNENREQQFSNYKNLNFEHVKPFIEKYFSPSDEILNLVSIFEKKYNLDYENIIACYYRGTDKKKETILCDYNSFIDKAKQIKNNNMDAKFLIVTDEINLINLFKETFSDTIVFTELIDNMKRSFIHSQIMLTSVLIMSKAKHIICTSSNVAMWTILFRGNANNLHQFLSPKEYIYNVKNKDYDKNRQLFWI